MKVPTRHREYFNRREFKKALKTSDKTEAQKKALCLAAQIDDCIQKLDVLKGYHMTKLPLFTTIQVDSAKVTKDSIEVFGFKSDPNFVEAEAVATKSFYDGLEAAQQRLINNTTPIAAQAAPVPEKTQPEIKKKTLAQLVEDFVKEKTKSGAWKNELANGRKAQLLKFVEFFGEDTDIATLTRDDANNFIDVIRRLPPNIKKKKKYVNKKLSWIAENNDGPTISPKSVNMCMNDVSGFGKWCVRFGYAPANRFEGLSVKETAQAITQRSPYTTQALSKLFMHKNFQEQTCDASEYFLPILGLYTGARLNELCQLETNDVKEIDGIWCIDINDNGPKKSLKTIDSKRIVPLHNEILNAGFIKYVQKLKPGQVFPNLDYKNGSFSGDYSKRFGTVRRNTKTTDFDFHSFRHTVTDELKNSNVKEHYVAALIGHKHAQLTFARYGGLSRVQKLHQIVNLLNYSQKIPTWKN